MALDVRSLDYKPIQLDDREIRLLEIQMGRDINDPVVSRMVNVKVTRDLEFIGLCALLRDSDDNDTEHIWVNASRVTVSKTLGQALRHVRALFLREKASLYQTSSNDSSSSGTQPSSPPSPRRASSSKTKKPPAWLRQVLRGFRSILPDESNPAARQVPLRVWLDCICVNLRDPAEAEQRRAHLTLAYESAKITVGWLGLKDETSDMGINTLRRLETLFPPNFGHPQDKIDHPENYSPIMQWLAPFGPVCAEDVKVNGGADKGPLYMAIMSFANRPFFKRQWIVEELTLSAFPAFLLGDEIISWQQMLQWNRTDIEFEKAGAQGICKEFLEAIRVMPKMDIAVVFTLLDAYDRRRGRYIARDLMNMTPSSSLSTNNSYGEPPPRPNTSRADGK
ncbi:hypothetical protein M406DRAFT_334552 [Cryphonectria parasitica EP155]|uniref:Heterokaryon incompatibility domain-containing protein n=1 Tax=Cryphonectria parasitica (strain ATCC 38755 / EP155) TaxID=660469 RepID=A0A9P4XU85_CRYP1|nr:uncharacterized protein M406DRAFT_334552 [Cryphonectria parasitica EP155]KAF3760931.1 hypothetical protein M406DRAFT_334552 [Cryphonectria parasitica EP155]